MNNDPKEMTPIDETPIDETMTPIDGTPVVAEPPVVVDPVPVVIVPPVVAVNPGETPVDPVIVAQPPTPAPVVVAVPSDPVRETVEIPVDGSSDIPLDHAPTVIQTVTLNGTPLPVGTTDANTFDQGYAFLYDASKQVLQVDADMKGMLKVVYDRASEIENATMTSMLNYYHQRITVLETMMEKLKAGGIV